MNLRPSGYEPDELPDCSTPRLLVQELVGAEAKRSIIGNRLHMECGVNVFCSASAMRLEDLATTYSPTP